MEAQQTSSETNASTLKKASTAASQRRASISNLPQRETRQSHAASAGQPSVTPLVELTQPVPVVAPVKIEPVWNPLLPSLPWKEFPTEEWAQKMQPDDLQDITLMLCARALASVGNRALCPKEIAEVMMYRGWTCTGTQPFAIVSTCIRKHLQRRGFGITNASHGKPVRPGLPPPLFASYELTGPPISVEAIGIDPSAKPAVKRGTLWYLSEEGTGHASPFGELDPNRFAKNVPDPPKPKLPSAPRRTSLPAARSLPSGELDYRSSAKVNRFARQESPEDGLTLGRGKRKRKVSSIAGGDASWHSHNPVCANSLPRSSTLGSFSEMDPNDPSFTSLTPEKSAITRIRVRLGSYGPTMSLASNKVDGPVLSKMDSEDEISDTEAIQARRFKKRSKSEGSLLSLASLTCQQGSLSPEYNNRTSLWSTFRNTGSLSATTSIASGDLRLERLEEEEDDADYMDVDTTTTFFPRTFNLPQPRQMGRSDPDEQDDFHEAMLKGDFDFDFDFALRRSQLIDSPFEQFDTPATTPRSWPDSNSLELLQSAELYNNAVKNHKSGVGAPEIVAIEAAPQASEATLSEEYGKLSASPSSSTDGLLSPAPDLPSLPIETAAKTIGFAPALGAEKVDAILSAHLPSEGSRAASIFSHRSLSPASPFASPSPLLTREHSPISETDSFDAELVVKSEPSPEVYFDSASPIPPFDDEETFFQYGTDDDHLESYAAFQPVDMAELDFIGWGPAAQEKSIKMAPVSRDTGRLLRSGRAAKQTKDYFEQPLSSCSTIPPTPFGPEVFGFTSAPTIDWKPATLFAGSAQEPKLDELSLDMIVAEEPLRQSVANGVDSNVSNPVDDSIIDFDECEVEIVEVSSEDEAARNISSKGRSEILATKKAHPPQANQSPIATRSRKMSKVKEERPAIAETRSTSKTHRRTSSRLSQK